MYTAWTFLYMESTTLDELPTQIAQLHFYRSAKEVSIFLSKCCEKERSHDEEHSRC